MQVFGKNNFFIPYFSVLFVPTMATTNYFFFTPNSK